MNEQTGGPAFPESGLSGLPNGEFIQGREGMTLRDYFAARAMAEYIRENYSDARDSGGCNWSERDIAEYSYSQADAMLEARKS